LDESSGHPPEPGSARRQRHPALHQATLPRTDRLPARDLFTRLAALPHIAAILPRRCIPTSSANVHTPPLSLLASPTAAPPMGAFVLPCGPTVARPSRAAAAVRRSPPHVPRPASRAGGGVAGASSRCRPTMLAGGGALPAAAALLLADDIYGEIALGGFAIIASGVVGALVTGWLVNRNYDVVRLAAGVCSAGRGWAGVGGGGWGAPSRRALCLLAVWRGVCVAYRTRVGLFPVHPPADLLACASPIPWASRY